MKKYISGLLFALFFITSARADDFVIVKNVYVTPTYSAGSPVCVFFDIKYTGPSTDKVEVVKVYSAGNYFKQDGDNYFTIIQRNSTSDISSCNVSGDKKDSLFLDRNLLSLSTMGTFIRVNESNKPISLSDKVFVDVHVKINNTNEKIYTKLATVSEYDELNNYYRDLAVKNAKDREKFYR